MGINNFFYLLIIIFLPIFILLTITSIFSFSLNTYKSNYIFHNIPNVTGYSLDQLLKITEDLLSFFKGNNKKEYFNNIFDRKENIHLDDVQYLFKKGFFIKDVSLIIVIISFSFLYKRDKEKFYNGIMYSSIISLSIIAFFIVIFSMEFNKYFTYFHKIFFTNDYWLLDANTNLLIQMFPQEFFVDVFYKIMITFILIMSILLIESVRFKRKYEEARDYGTR